MGIFVFQWIDWSEFRDAIRFSWLQSLNLRHRTIPSPSCTGQYTSHAKGRANTH